MVVKTDVTRFLYCIYDHIILYRIGFKYVCLFEFSHNVQSIQLTNFGRLYDASCDYLSDIEFKRQTIYFGENMPRFQLLIVIKLNIELCFLAKDLSISL